MTSWDEAVVTALTRSDVTLENRTLLSLPQNVDRELDKPSMISPSGLLQVDFEASSFLYCTDPRLRLWRRQRTPSSSELVSVGSPAGVSDCPLVSRWTQMWPPPLWATMHLTDRSPETWSWRTRCASCCPRRDTHPWRCKSPRRCACPWRRGGSRWELNSSKS